jgi:hypothetical protein
VAVGGVVRSIVLRTGSHHTNIRGVVTDKLDSLGHHVWVPDECRIFEFISTR